MNKAEQINKIGFEIKTRYTWQCPVCLNERISDEELDTSEFIEDLYTEGVRFKTMKHMQGVFCKECYTDPEIQNSSV